MIRLLDSTTINRIAAGEVVERPASAVKELVENAIDAGSTQIDITIRDGGQSYICVMDNGCGMRKKDLALCVERHATSKLPDNDLMSIATMGFRGEALPSIGAVSRLTITSSAQGSKESWSLMVEGGTKKAPIPASHSQGTKVEIKDLFFATPARLKFMRTPKTEQTHIVDVLTKLALANPAVGFTLKNESRHLFQYAATSDPFQRIQDILGKDFSENALPIEGERDYLNISGYIGLPTLHRSAPTHQYLFVNGRPVQDKLFSGAVRAAYSDLLAKDKHPMLALFLSLPSDYVDVNVHPAKTEVRFQDVKFVRSLVVNTIKNHLNQSSHLTSTTIHQAALDAMQVFQPSLQGNSHSASSPSMGAADQTNYPKAGHFPSYKTLHNTAPYEKKPGSSQQSFSHPFHTDLKEQTPAQEHYQPFQETEHVGYLGHAKGQIYDTYIVSQTESELVITDQHAAHERLRYEKMKNAIKENGVASQAILVPEFIELNPEQLEHFMAIQPTLGQFGLVYEQFGQKGILVKQVPAILGIVNTKQIFEELIDLVADIDAEVILQEKVHEICASLACKGSVKAGRKLTIPEMNALLREMEQTPFSGQCNHGRPTYIKLKKYDIEKLFGRA